MDDIASTSPPGTPAQVEPWIAKLSDRGTPTAEILERLERLAAPLRAQTRDPMFIKLRQQYALHLSKFSAKPAELRHAEALKVLRDDLELEKTKDPETLGIAGGICKRMWDDQGQRVDIDRAVVYYNRAHDNKGPGDDYYKSINAAYLEEVVAAQELAAGFEAGAVHPR